MGTNLLKTMFADEKQVMVVAEIGNNHEGNFEVAQRLVRTAADCGVDAVKFQLFRTEFFVPSSNVSRFNQLKGYELSYNQFEQLVVLARELGLCVIATPLDLESAAFLEKVVDIIKIASGDNQFYPLISQVALTGKPVIISTGLSDFEQVEKSVSFIRNRWQDANISDQLILLHCVSSYPAPQEQANLRSIPFLAQRFHCPVGYSDHTLGIEACGLAIALGARMIEKHFTLDKAFSDFRDHQLSADPVEMKVLVNIVRQTLAMLGENNKIVQPCEIPGCTNYRRSIVAARNLSRGHRLEESDLIWMRPGGNISPGNENVLIGMKIKRNIAFGEPFLLSDTVDEL